MKMRQIFHKLKRTLKNIIMLINSKIKEKEGSNNNLHLMKWKSKINNKSNQNNKIMKMGKKLK